MPKLGVITSLAAGALEVVALCLAFHSFSQLRPDLFTRANLTDDPRQEWAMLPYATAFAGASGVLLGNAALLDLWLPLVRGHGAGVSKYVSAPVNLLKAGVLLVVLAWAVPSTMISSFFNTAALINSTDDQKLCSATPAECSRAASVSVEACASAVMAVVCIAAHCCGSCRFCPGHKVKFTDVMIRSSTGVLRKFAWLWAFALGLAAMATQLVLAWMATDDDLDVNASALAVQTWTQIPWVVRGLALGSTALILFATLCDITGVALDTDRVQKLATDRVGTTGWVLKSGAMVTSVLCAACVSADMTHWTDEACSVNDAACVRASKATVLAWVSAMLVDLCLVASWLHRQHLAFRRHTEMMGMHRGDNHNYNSGGGGGDYRTATTTGLQDGAIDDDMYSELRDDELDLDGNMILNDTSSPPVDGSQDIISVGADGRIYTGGTV